MKRLFSTLLLFLFISIHSLQAQNNERPKLLNIGYAMGITHVTEKNMRYAKSVGINCIEVSFGSLIDQTKGTFKYSDEKISEIIAGAKKAANGAGIEIWSIHMPFGKNIDLSLAEEPVRQKVVTFQRKVLELCKPLQPQIILFHPSYYLGLNEREVRKAQLVKSATELNRFVRDMKATMVIENMLGPELLVDETRERPLCRSVEETVEIMNMMPGSIYSAIDMNHIKEPEKLIRAMGKRLKSVHIADGTGEAENHFFPCSGEGKNNWPEILSALHEVKYTGPFMFESAIKDTKDYKECYEALHHSFTKAKFGTAVK